MRRFKKTLTHGPTWFELPESWDKDEMGMPIMFFSSDEEEEGEEEKEQQLPPPFCIMRG